MIAKALDQVTEADLQALISNEVREGRAIEYKRELSVSSDAEKKEFLADISSFANTGGGDLIFGIEEDAGAPRGISGLTFVDQDAEIRRVESVIASGLEPRIRYELRVIACQAGPVLVFRTERSWTGPHRVVFKGHDKFYGRNAAGKYPLDVMELRSAFALTGSVAEKIRAFRMDRVISLAKGETPLPFVEGAKLILHLLPVEAFVGQATIDVVKYAQPSGQLQLKPMATSSWSNRINLDGVISYSSSGGPHPIVYTYTQLYRSGVLEAVNGTLLNQEHQGRHIIPSIAYEQRPMQYLPLALEVLRSSGVAPPVVVALTLAGVKGFEMSTDRFAFVASDKIPQEILMLPEHWLTDFATPPGKILKPMFDIVWNACGFERSSNFDNEGNWIAR